ncbi:MAG: LeoA/HP0731 family dynamin-like GTPase, partial [Anaerolineaceae bacterium]
IKFKPWQAVNIAKNIGNIAKVLGPVTSVLGLLLDVKETVDDQKKLQKVQQAQLKYRQSFIDIASDIESQYSNELNGIFAAYGEISAQLKTSRDDVQGMIKSNDEMSRRLLEIRNDLTDIQSEIFSV